MLLLLFEPESPTTHPNPSPLEHYCYYYCSNLDLPQPHPNPLPLDLGLKDAWNVIISILLCIMFEMNFCLAFFSSILITKCLFGHTSLGFFFFVEIRTFYIKIEHFVQKMYRFILCL